MAGTEYVSTLATTAVLAVANFVEERAINAKRHNSCDAVCLISLKLAENIFAGICIRGRSNALILSQVGMIGD
ncbi:hypothetical protein CI789_22700 (plasmid) [Erwinia persicina]|nr:hypothetical protein CI789_22700 [Erwinia persicina]